MAFPHSVTEYELGTQIYWVLRKPESMQNAMSIMLAKSIPIIEDPDEKWLDGVPEDRRISRDAAARALAIVRAAPLSDGVKAIVRATELYYFHLRRLAEERDEVERKFRLAASSFLERPAADSDIDLLLAQHREREVEKKSIEALIGQKPTESQVDIGEDPTPSDGWENLGPAIVQKPKDPNDPAERERRDYEQMARIIRRVEGSKS